jgi:tetratricopeptide (TPR) repeat protein
MTCLHVPLAGQPAVGLHPSHPDRERARIQNRLGWEYMRAEEWDAAAAAFQRAVEIDPAYEYAYYGLGRAELARRRYPAAIAALERCRALYLADAGRQFSNAQDAQRYRRDRIMEIDEQLRQLRSAPPTFRTQDLIRQLEALRREINDRIERGNNLTIRTQVPAFVSLSLGSAYFRAGRLADAEREYQNTLEADPRSGEAYNNLAVVYLETGRPGEALTAIQAARKLGFHVNPALERAIKERLK